jgi:hypothetical protein
MIERFNFYDVYGYFIPGAFLIGVLWLPHALVWRSIPSTDVSAAVAMIVAAYITGHILQIVAAKVVPSSITAGGATRAPSDRLLDDDNSRFSSDFKQQLRTAIQSRFGIDVSDQKNRGTAFFLCRDSVIASKTASYVEQFEGMYALMRGIAVAAAVGAAYDIGWLWSAFICSRNAVVPSLLLVAAVVVALYYRLVLKPTRARMTYCASFLIAATCMGILVCGGIARATGSLSVAAYLSLLIACWAFAAYREFTWIWARTVYQHFYLASRSPDSNQKPA